MNPGGASAQKRTLLRALRNSVVVIGFYGVLMIGLLWAFDFWGAGEAADGKSARIGASAETFGAFVRSDYTPRKAIVAEIAAEVEAGTFTGFPAGMTSLDAVPIESNGITGAVMFNATQSFSKWRVALRLRRYRMIDELPGEFASSDGWIFAHDDALHFIAGNSVVMDGHPDRDLEFSVLTRQSMGDWDASGNPILGWAETSRIQLPAGSMALRLHLNLRNHLVAPKFSTRHSGIVIDPRNQLPVAGALVEIKNPSGVVSCSTNQEGRFSVISRSGYSTIVITKDGADRVEIPSYDYRMLHEHHFEQYGGHRVRD